MGSGEGLGSREGKGPEKAPRRGKGGQAEQTGREGQAGSWGEGIAVDIHTHPCSRDSLLSLKHLASRAGEGLTFAVTDHNSVECLPKARQVLPSFIPGVEVSTREGHLLLLFVEEAPPKGIPVEEAVAFAHERGGIAVAAHPFDPFRSSIGVGAPEKLSLVDALELNQKAPSFANTLAVHYAQILRKPLLAGSDAHLPQELGLSQTLVEELSPQGLLRGRPLLKPLPPLLKALRLPLRLLKALRLE